MFDTRQRLREAGSHHVRNQKRKRQQRLEKLRGRCHEMTPKQAKQWFLVHHGIDLSIRTLKKYATSLGEQFQHEPTPEPKGKKTIDYDAADREAAMLNRRMMTLWPVRQGECYE